MSSVQRDAAVLGTAATTSQARSPWWVVFAATFGMIVGNGPLIQFSFAVFVKPLSLAFDVDRATISSALLVAFVMTALFTPLAGRLIDRRGVRALVLPGITLFALSIAALGFIPQTAPQFILMYGLAGVFAAGQTPLPYAKAVAGAFGRRRGIAIGLSTAGVGIGTALLPHLANALISSYGWRAGYVGLGVCVFVIAFPAVYLYLREPIPVAALTRVSVPGITARESFSTRQFWCMAFVFFAMVTACGGAIAHIPALLSDRGVSPQLAASALSAAGAALIVGRLLTGYLLDRVFGPYIALAFLVLPLLGMGLLCLPAQPAVAAAAAICVGLGLGAEVDLIAFFISRYLGMKAFGEIYGYLFAVFTFGSGIGPYLMGLSYSRTGSYGPTIVGFAVALVAACVAVLLLGPYKYPAEGQEKQGR